MERPDFKKKPRGNSLLCSGHPSELFTAHSNSLFKSAHYSIMASTSNNATGSSISKLPTDMKAILKRTNKGYKYGLRKI